MAQPTLGSGGGRGGEQMLEQDTALRKKNTSVSEKGW